MPKPISYEQMIRLFKDESEKMNLKIQDLDWAQDCFVALPQRLRGTSAWTILENDPHVLALQEVESIQALQEFNDNYLKSAYKYAYVWPGEDSRHLNIGLLSKFQVIHVRNNRFDRMDDGKLVFLRDCVEVTIQLFPQKKLHLFIAHFALENECKLENREVQALRLRKRIEEKFGSHLEGNFVVLGSFNQSPDAKELTPLLTMRGLENILETRLPEEERWNVFNKTTKEASLHDYILLSPSLSSKNPDLMPVVERKGLSREVEVYTGKRFNTRHLNDERAVEHCGIFVDLFI